MLRVVMVHGKARATALARLSTSGSTVTSASVILRITSPPLNYGYFTQIGSTVLAKERKLNFGESLQGRYSAGKTSGPDRARRCAAMDPSGPSFLHPSTENSTAGF